MRILYHAANRFFIILLVFGLSGCNTDDSVSAQLQQQVAQELSGLPFVPQQNCALTPMNDSQAETAYIQARAEALAHVLTAPQAQGLGANDLLDIFSAGVEVATGTQDGAFLIDEHDGFLLVSMKLPVCAHRHKYQYLPQLYVFSQAGDYWRLGPGIIQSIEWVRDRWIGMMRLQIEEGQEQYAFVHVVQEGEGWRLLTFDDVSNGPGLMYLSDPGAVDYAQGYNQIAYTSSSYVYGPLPCVFDDVLLSSMESRSSCHDCEVRPAHALYQGTFTFVWTDDHYVLTDKTPYQITIILSDLTRLEEDAPTQAELAENSPLLRPSSWRDYCQSTLPAEENYSEPQEQSE
jgi:hypothetical protein